MIQLSDSHRWFKRSRQVWRIRLMWTLGALVVVVGTFGFWTQWRTHTFNSPAALIVLGSGIGAFTIGALVRCRVCGERVVATLYQHRPRSQFIHVLELLNECPVCADPGDGSNPKRW